METLRCVIEWLDKHQGLATWAQGLFTLAAGLVAIKAAQIAYRGAMAQAAAVERVHLAAQEDGRRSLAAALWAELGDCRMRLFGMSRQLRKSKVTRPSMLPLRHLNFEIYEANTSSIGNLPSDLAWAVVQTYKALGDRQRRIRSLLESSSQGMSDGFAMGLADELDASRATVDATLSLLAKLAKFESAIPRFADDTIAKIDAGQD